MAASHAFVHPAGAAKFEGLKMVAKLEDHGLGKDSVNNGIGSMHHIRMEWALNENFVSYFVVCFCSYCKNRLRKPTVEERYRGPRSGCRL